MSIAHIAQRTGFTSEEVETVLCHGAATLRQMEIAYAIASVTGIPEGRIVGGNALVDDRPRLANSQAKYKGPRGSKARRYQARLAAAESACAVGEQVVEASEEVPVEVADQPVEQPVTTDVEAAVADEDNVPGEVEFEELKVSLFSDVVTVFGVSPFRAQRLMDRWTTAREVETGLNRLFAIWMNRRVSLAA